MKLALRTTFRQIPPVRWARSVVAIGLAVAGSHAHAAPAASNPAFLGIRMQSVGAAGCEVSSITRGSSAEDAGLRAFDIIIAIDGVVTPRCDVLQSEIVGKSSGQSIRLDVRRNAERITVTATLSTRAEVLHRRIVGQSLDSIDVVDADDEKRHFDLSANRGKTVILGWFQLDECAGCDAVFDRIADGVAQRLKDSESTPAVLAVTSRPKPGLRSTSLPGVAPAAVPIVTNLRRHWGFASTVPMALASKDTFEELAIDDPDRVSFMVVDCRGVVRFVAPIAPGSKDLDAAVDEVLAAAEQAENSRTRRRGGDETDRSLSRPVDSLRSLYR